MIHSLGHIMASFQSKVANICRFSLLSIIVSFSCTMTVEAEELATTQGEIGLDEQISSYIKHLRLLSASGKYDQDHMASLLEQGRLLSLRPRGIETFRKLDDLELISEIVRVIAAGSRGVRISGSLLLANIVDNTTLCAVINALADERLDQFARFNFIQILKVVSGYANQDNTKWIDQVLRKNNVFCASS